MSLADDARKRNSAPGPKCSLDSIWAELGDELTEALNDHTIQALALASALRDRGYAVNVDTLGRHRKGQCMTCRRAGRL